MLLEKKGRVLKDGSCIWFVLITKLFWTESLPYHPMRKLKMKPWDDEQCS